MSYTVHHFVNGNFVEEANCDLLEITNPATNKAVAKVAMASDNMVKQAIDAAYKAFPNWSHTSALARSRILARFKDIVEAKSDEFAQILTQEHGKTIADAKGELQRALEVVEFAIGAPHLLKGEFSHNVGKHIDSWSMYQPLGVCAGITPFNFPAMVPMWMFPVALACGNTFVLKPSEQDPTCTIELAKCLSEAGLPDGVFNVINGNKSAVDYLLDDPKVKAISFVGSTPVAEAIYKRASQSKKRVQALGGAKNHLIAMPDADLDQTVNGIMGAAFGSAGERCMAVSVVVAVGDIADPLVSKLTNEIQLLRVGAGTENNVDMGPVISHQHLNNIKQLIAKGEQQGAKLLLDGRNIVVAGYEQGSFLGGTLFDHVKPEMEIYQQEIFGPVLCVVRVKDYAEAVALINEHAFGNGGAIYTKNGQIARNFVQDVECGMVGVNVAIPVPMAFHSFGGWKQSLFGQSHVHGPEGVRFYTRLKTVTTRWAPDQNDPVYQMPTVS